MPPEAEPLIANLRQPQKCVIGRKRGLEGWLDGVPVLIVFAGMGKTNTAQVLTAVLETREVHGIIAFGVAGAYPGSGLDVGDVALASEAVYGDEGSQTPTGWIDTEAMGIPLLETDAVRRFNAFPLDQVRVSAAERVLGAAGISVRAGRFLSVSGCAGTSALATQRAVRFGALCEDMETAAAAHVAELYAAPLLAVRGISNLVEDRDPARWRIVDAAEAACRAVRSLAAHWNS